MNNNNHKKQVFTEANMLTYIKTQMVADIKEFAESGQTKSGYSNLDMVTNLYPGFYVLGAISSLGKTTFSHQMADQIAKNGQPVIFFSYEQNLLELSSKSLSRSLALRDMNNAMTSLQLRSIVDNPRLPEAISEYESYAGNMTILHCTFDMTIDNITGYVNNFINKNNVKPVVIIDYLQVIQTPSASRMTAKESVDYNVRRLKQLQADNKIVLIVISAVNRQNYMAQVDFESFKESGGIEYTADVVWGLQLQVLHDEIFDKMSQLNEKRQRIKDAKASDPRKIEFVCLKNRFGISSYTLYFDYYPAYDLFVPDLSNINDLMLNTICNKDGFASLPSGYKSPFDQSESPITRKCF